MAILNCIIGIIFVFLVAFLISNNKKKINWKNTKKVEKHIKVKQESQ